MKPADFSQRRGISRARIVFSAALVMFAAWAVTVVLVYAQSSGEKLTWGADYSKWKLASGFVISPSHGSRYFRVYGNTREAANLYRFNGERLRYRDGEGTAKFPVGTVLAMETFDITADNKAGKKGPVFFMRKEAPGFDDAGGDWRYGMMNTEGAALVDGKDGHATECRKCHAQASARDFVFAKDR
jgi:hypothetical protein